MSPHARSPHITLGSLNVNGLRDLAKRQTLFNCLREGRSGLDFLFIQETHHGSHAEAEQWVGRGAGPGLPWQGQAAWAHGTSASRGVGILVRSGMAVEGFEVLHAGASGRLLVVGFEMHGQRFRAACIYAPTDPVQRREFFAGELAFALPAVEDVRVVTLLGGDFNCVEDLTLDQVGSGSTSRHEGFVEGLHPLQDRLGLVDAYRVLNPRGREFTHRSASACSAARLDRWLVVDHAMPGVRSVGVEDGWPGDHRLVVIRLHIRGAPLRGPGSWVFPAHLLTDGGFVADLRTALLGWLHEFPAGIGGEGERWELMKALVRDFVRRHTGGQAAAARAAAASQQRRAAEAATRWAAAPGDPHTAAALAAEQLSLRAAASTRARRAAQVAGVLWEDYGESSTAYFHRLGQQRRAATTINSLVDMVPQPAAVPVAGVGAPLLDLSLESGVDRARAVVAGFFDGDREGALFAPRAPDLDAQALLLASLDRQLPAVHRDACEESLNARIFPRAFRLLFPCISTT